MKRRPHAASSRETADKAARPSRTRHEAVNTDSPALDSVVANNKATIRAEVQRIGELPAYRCVRRYLTMSLREAEYYEDVNPYAIEEGRRPGLVLALERFERDPGVIDLSKIGVGESVIFDQIFGEIVRAAAIIHAGVELPLVIDIGTPAIRVDPNDYITYFEAVMQMLRGLPSART